MKLNFGINKNYVIPFCNLYQSSERWLKDESLIIDREKFASGYAIYAFDLVPTDLGEGYINLVHQGNVGIYARFASPTSDTISAITHCECPGLLRVDNTREVRQLRIKKKENEVR